MAEKKRERVRRKVDNPTEPSTVETKKGKQTKFVVDLGDVKATDDKLDDIKSSLLKTAIAQVKGLTTTSGDKVQRPEVGVELFSMSFSMSFSLGA